MKCSKSRIFSKAQFNRIDCLKPVHILNIKVAVLQSCIPYDIGRLLGNICLLIKQMSCVYDIIIHQTHYEKSDWSRTWHDKCNICCRYCIFMSSSTSAWFLSPLECSPQKQNGWTLRFCFWGWILWKMYNKTIIEVGFCMISWIIKTSCLCYLPQPLASADLGFDNSWYHAQPHQ